MSIENVELQDVEELKLSDGEVLLEKSVDLIGHIKASAEVKVGTIDISIEKLFNIKNGEVLELNESVDEKFCLMINGKRVAEGNLVVVDDKFGFEVVDVF